MHPDVAKLVDAGRIPKSLGERLSQLSPGNFCLHKSFGAGRVREWDLPAKRVVVDFEKSANQVMDLQFALQKTEWIAADDFRARKIGENETLRALSGSDPVALVTHLLQSHQGRMTADEIERELSGAVIPADAFKKWWEDAKKRVREPQGRPAAETYRPAGPARRRSKSRRGDGRRVRGGPGHQGDDPRA